MTYKEAQDFISSLIELRNDATDAQASKAVNIYPSLHNDGKLIRHDTRINWKGKIKRASVDLYDNEQSNPDTAPTLWEDINYREGYRIIPEVITAGTAFKKDEKGWWGDKLYISKQNNNTWNPKNYPDAWKEVSDHGIQP